MSKLNEETNYIGLIAFYECFTSKIYDFYSLLGQLTKSTTELIFRKHSAGLALDHLLSLCPKLTYLSFKDTAHEHLKPQDVPYVADSQVEFTSLTHLFVDVTEKHVTQKLLPILRHCPNLRYLGYKCIHLVMDEEDEDAFLPHPTAIDLDDLFSLCPKLIYLELNSEEFLNHQNIQIPINSNEDTHGLRFFTARETEHNNPAKIGKYLGQHADSLEYLSIRGGDSDWTSVLRRLQLPRLRSLACSNITYEDGAMDIILNHSVILEELTIICIRRANLHVIRALRSLTRLRCLKLHGVSLYYGGNPTATAAQIGQPVSKPALQEISLANSHPVSDELLQTLTWSYALKSVAIDFPPQADDQYMGDMLCRFIEGLNRTKIESLRLSGLQHPSAASIRAIGSLQTIRRVALFNPDHGMKIDGTALLQMLRNKTLGSVGILGLKLLGDKDDDTIFEQIEIQGFEMSKIYDRNTGLYNVFLKAK